MPDLAEARAALASAIRNYQLELDKLDLAIRSKDYADAQVNWKDAHDNVLAVKAAHNAIYKHLGELKPKSPKADKLKPGGKLDNAPARADRGKKARAAETEAEPTDDRSDDDRDAP